MPLVQVTAPKGKLDQKNRDDLMSRLSIAVIKAEGADANDPAAKALVWAYYQECPEGACYVGGESLQGAPLCIEFATPQGALNEKTRKALVEEVGVIVDDIVGPSEDGLNHWALLREIDEGGWGAGGQIVGLAAIQKAMNINAGSTSQK